MRLQSGCGFEGKLGKVVTLCKPVQSVPDSRLRRILTTRGKCRNSFLLLYSGGS